MPYEDRKSGIVLERIDREPNESEIALSALRDPIGRNADVGRFLGFLAQVQPPFSLFVDARWGEGKTFFVKTICSVLVGANPNLKVSVPGELDSFVEGFRAAIAEEASFLPFYFNAWENDCDDEPICSLLASMATEYQYDTVERETDVFALVAAGLDTAAALSGFGFGRAADFAGAVRKKDPLRSYKDKRAIEKTLGECIDAILLGRAEKAVVFIDELDRCRPSYALKLLEQTKSLRLRKDVILVFSTDMIQLSQALAGLYGVGFNSAKYLERFYDYKFALSTVNKVKYFEGMGFVNGGCRYDSIVSELIEKIDPSLRDCHRLRSLIDLRGTCTSINPTFGDEFVKWFAYSCLVPVLVVLRYENPGLWERVRTGHDFEKVYEYAYGIAAFSDCIDLVIDRTRGIPAEEVDEAARKAFVVDLCTVIYERDHSSSRFQASLGSLHSFWLPAKTSLFDNLNP